MDLVIKSKTCSVYIYVYICMYVYIYRCWRITCFYTYVCVCCNFLFLCQRVTRALKGLQKSWTLPAINFITCVEPNNSGPCHQFHGPIITSFHMIITWSTEELCIQGQLGGRWWHLLWFISFQTIKNDSVP